MAGLHSPAPGPSTPIQTPYKDASLLDSESDRNFSSSAMSQAKQIIMTNNDVVIIQREQEIEEIAHGIIELANIFQDLQSLVIDQGSMLDRIDYNVEKMAVDVKEAARELEAATTYQRRSLKRKIMFFLLLVIVGIVILLGLKLGSKSSGSADSPPPPVSPPLNDALEGHGTPSTRSLALDNVPAAMLKRDWRRRRRRRRMGVAAHN
jgi:syntaxin 16